MGRGRVCRRGGSRNFHGPADKTEGGQGSPGRGRLGGPSHTYSLTPLRPGSTNQEPKRGEGRGGARTNEVGSRVRAHSEEGGTSGKTLRSARPSVSAHLPSPQCACGAGVNPFVSFPMEKLLLCCSPLTPSFENTYTECTMR